MLGPANRNMLHKSKLEKFKDWCAENSIMTRPSLANFQVMQVYVDPYGWLAIYEKINAREHYSVDRRMTDIVKQFISDCKESKA